MSKIEQIYTDQRLGKADKRVLEYLQGKEKRPIDLWNDGIIKNRNQLYGTLKKLEELGYLIKREDPALKKSHLYTTNYYTPVPRSYGWQRYILESQMAKYRNAAKLGLHLYYYCVEQLESHGDRCLSLAEGLGIESFVSKIMEMSRTATAQHTIELLRKVDTKIREHHDNIVGAAFSLTYWISISLKRDSLSETNPKRRILDELRILTEEWWVNDYSKDCLDAWFSRHNVDNRTLRDRIDHNGRLFLHILNLYITTFGTQHTQRDLLRHFFEENLPLGDERFKEKAEKLLIRRTGTISIISGSGDFKNVRPQNKTIEIKSNTQLKGGIRLGLTVNTPESNLVPLVVVITWLPRNIKNQGWLEIDRNLEKRFEVFKYPAVGEVLIDHKGPKKKGRYYLIFAFAEETDGEYVSSMTNWRINYPVWNDRCDVADMTESQIVEIQKNGYVDTYWLKEYGYAPAYLAADAIKLEVI